MGSTCYPVVKWWQSRHRWLVGGRGACVGVSYRGEGGSPGTTFFLIFKVSVRKRPPASSKN